MTKNPAISVIVPVYNVERYIKFCVDSILNQTFRDFEIILVDDATPDDSLFMATTKRFALSAMKKISDSARRAIPA